MSLHYLIHIIFLEQTHTSLYIPIKSNHKKRFTILLLTSPSQLAPVMVVNNMELNDLIFQGGLSLMIVEQLFCTAAPLIDLWTGRTNSFGRYHC